MSSHLVVWKAVLLVVLCRLTATAAVDAKGQFADAVQQSIVANAVFSKRQADAGSALVPAAVGRSPVVSSQEAKASDSSSLPPLIPLPLLLGPGRFRNPQVRSPVPTESAGSA
jgi:hypothetical protein